MIDINEILAPGSLLKISDSFIHKKLQYVLILTHDALIDDYSQITGLTIGGTINYDFRYFKMLIDCGLLKLVQSGMMTGYAKRRVKSRR